MKEYKNTKTNKIVTMSDETWRLLSSNKQKKFIPYEEYEAAIPPEFKNKGLQSENKEGIVDDGGSSGKGAKVGRKNTRSGKGNDAAGVQD